MPTDDSPDSAGAPGGTWWLVAAWAVAVAVVAALAGRFWIPLDDGTLAQSAERVLTGQLPHRDFDDPYTGLNALTGALALRLFGNSLASLRVPVVVGFALWLPSLWGLARRFGRGIGVPLASTGLAATLSVLTYPAAMPTWFCLFAGTWGVWLLARFFDGGGRGWLFAAGATAGVAVLFKVVGLYLLAAWLLALAWHRCSARRVPLSFVAGSCGLFLVLLAAMVLRRPDASTTYHFLVPAVALCLSVIVVSRQPGEVAPVGMGALLVDGSALLAGGLLPVVLFLVPYAASDSLGAWAQGVFLSPASRLASASSRPGSVWTLLPGAAAVMAWAWGDRLRPHRRRHIALAMALLWAAGLAIDDALGGGITASLWYALRGWVTPLTCWGAWLMVRRGRPLDPTAFALLATAGLWALVQFPYAAPAYFFYVAPVAVLATLAVASIDGGPPGPVLAVLALVAGFLGAGYVAGVSLSATTLLDLDRGGILVAEEEAMLYSDLVNTVDAHLDGGTLWAGPDAPEVYYLSGAQNPTRTLYEFLRAPGSANQEHEAPWRRPDVRVVVVNSRPLFSETLGPETLSLLEEAFPGSRELDPFLIRWRDP